MTVPTFETLLRAWVDHLATSGHYVDLARRHPDAGGDPSTAGFTPYVVVWPQPSQFGSSLDDTAYDDQTVVQASCWAADPDIAGRVADDITTVALAPPSTLAGRRVVEVRMVGRRGPHRDPDDDRLWTVALLPRLWTA